MLSSSVPIYPSALHYITNRNLQYLPAYKIWKSRQIWKVAIWWEEVALVITIATWTLSPQLPPILGSSTHQQKKVEGDFLSCSNRQTCLSWNTRYLWGSFPTVIRNDKWEMSRKILLRGKWVDRKGVARWHKNGPVSKWGLQALLRSNLPTGQSPHT